MILGLPMMLAAFVMSASPALAQRGLDGSVPGVSLARLGRNVTDSTFTRQKGLWGSAALMGVRRDSMAR